MKKPYIVIHPFNNIDGAYLRPGDTIMLDNNRAAKLRRYGKIGGVKVSPPGIKKNVEPGGDMTERGGFPETADKKFPVNNSSGNETAIDKRFGKEKRRKHK